MKYVFQTGGEEEMTQSHFDPSIFTEQVDQLLSNQSQYFSQPSEDEDDTEPDEEDDYMKSLYSLNEDLEQDEERMNKELSERVRFQEMVANLDDVYAQREQELINNLAYSEYMGSPEGQQHVLDMYDPKKENVPYIYNFANVFKMDYSLKSSKISVDDISYPLPKSGINPNIQPLFEEYSSKYGVGNLGVWGDAGHQRRKSDHNTGNAIDLNTKGVRMDIATDLANKAKEKNISRIIHNNKEWTPNSGWHKYSGSNPHSGHIHVSFNK